MIPMKKKGLKRGLRAESKKGDMRRKKKTRVLD